MHDLPPLQEQLPVGLRHLGSLLARIEGSCVRLGPTSTGVLTQPSHQSSPFCTGGTEAPRGKGGGMTRFAESLSGNCAWSAPEEGLWADINSIGGGGRPA